jgi:hypothetical protein
MSFTERAPAIRALTEAMAGASGDKIVRAVEVIEALTDRGAADSLIDVVRPQLRELQPRRRLRFARLLLHPLDPVIVAPGAWRSNQPTLPRDALVRLAQHVRRTMGQAAEAIDAEVSGYTTDDVALIGRIGRGLWVEAATILAAFAADVADGKNETCPGGSLMGPVARKVAALLAEASAIEALVVESADGLLPPRIEIIRPLVERVVETQPTALPIFLTILIARVPHSVGCLDDLLPGRAGLKVRAARDDAAAMLLQRLGSDLDIAAQINIGSLIEAAARAQQWLTMLAQLATRRAERDLRTPVQDIRLKLDHACRARFTQTLERDLLAPLRAGTDSLDGMTATVLEKTARGLRALEAAARSAGSGPVYDKLLAAAAAFIGDPARRKQLSLAEQVRLVETLAGSQAALALLSGQAKPARPKP